jgi:flagellar protein FlaD
MEKVGYEGCIDALNHYVDIGWVSEDAYIELSKLVRSLASSWDERAKPLGYLTPNDHLRSLLFIEELMGKRREVVEEA